MTHRPGRGYLEEIPPVANPDEVAPEHADTEGLEQRGGVGNGGRRRVAGLGASQRARGLTQGISDPRGLGRTDPGGHPANAFVGNLHQRA